MAAFFFYAKLEKTQAISTGTLFCHQAHKLRTETETAVCTDVWWFFVFCNCTFNSKFRGWGVCLYARVCVFADGCLLVWESVRHVLLPVYLVCGENVFIFWLFKAVFKMRNKCNTELQRLFSCEWAAGGIGFLNLEDGGNAQHNNVFIIFNHLKFMILIYIDTDRRLIFLLYSLYFILKWRRYIVLN